MLKTDISGDTWSTDQKVCFQEIMDQTAYSCLQIKPAKNLVGWYMQSSLSQRDLDCGYSCRYSVLIALRCLWQTGLVWDLFAIS